MLTNPAGDKGDQDQDRDLQDQDLQDQDRDLQDLQDLQDQDRDTGHCRCPGPVCPVSPVSPCPGRVLISNFKEKLMSLPIEVTTARYEQGYHTYKRPIVSMNPYLRRTPIDSLGSIYIPCNISRAEMQMESKCSPAWQLIGGIAMIILGIALAVLALAWGREFGIPWALIGVGVAIGGGHFCWDSLTRRKF